MRSRYAVILLTGNIVLALNVTAPAANDVTLAFMAIVAETTQPIGHYEFCLALPEECEVRSPPLGPVVLTDLAWAQLVEVNNLVNAAVVPATDQELFGRIEVWVYPATRGDCEDYVLLKRRILAENGWPLAALLITVVKRPDGEGHAVLTVRTDRGDLVLDNLDGEIRVWSETPYLFLKRQSERHTGRWVAIADVREDVARLAKP